MYSRNRKNKNDKPQQQKPKVFRCCEYLCSKCHLRLKSGVYSQNEFIEMTYKFDPKTAKLTPHFEVIKLNGGYGKGRLDAWCFRCLAESDPLERTRKTSRGEKKRLLAKKEENRRARLAEIQRQVEEKQRKQAEAAKNKTVSVRKPRKSSADDAPTLNLVYEDTGRPFDPAVSFDDAIDYEILAARIAKASDPQLFDFVEKEDEEGDESW